MSDHKGSLTLATATLQDIISQGKAMSAATIRQDSDERRGEIRAEAHRLVDDYLDHMGDAGAHTRAILQD